MRITKFRGSIIFAASWLATHAIADDSIIGQRADQLPIFDAHMHYHEPAWGEFSPASVVNKMNHNNITGSLLSAAPDAGAIRLHEFAPSRFVLEASPYHDDITKSNWTRADSSEILGYLTGRLNQHPHEGMGELVIQSFDPQDTALLGELAVLAESRNLLVHLHADFAVVEMMYGFAPDLTMIWAHAGMVDPPDIVGRTLGKFPKLYADLSYREHQILRIGDQELNPQWKAVLIKHSDRFMVGSDTWSTDRWQYYDQLIRINRQWLSLMPESVAEAIAYKNAERVFGRSWSDTDFADRAAE